MLTVLLAGCASQIHSSLVVRKFRAEYGCEPKVSNLGGTSYEARGCGHRATYVCGNTQGNFGGTPTCIQESGDAREERAAVGQRMAWTQPPGRVDRHYDEANQALVVQGDFTPGAGIGLQLLGSPKVKLGDIAVHVVLPKYAMKTPCNGIELLINGTPTPSAPTESLAEGYRTRLIAHFDFQQFKPLAQRFPSFGVRRCGYEMRLNDADVQQLQKFLAIYSDMATEAQSAQPAGTPADAPPDGTLSL